MHAVVEASCGSMRMLMIACQLCSGLGFVSSLCNNAGIIIKMRSSFMEWIFAWCSSLKCMLQREADHWESLEILLKSRFFRVVIRVNVVTKVRAFLLCFDSEGAINVCVCFFTVGWCSAKVGAQTNSPSRGERGREAADEWRTEVKENTMINREDMFVYLNGIWDWRNVLFNADSWWYDDCSIESEGILESRLSLSFILPHCSAVSYWIIPI